MSEKSLGERVLTIQISAALGGDTGQYDINGLVHDVITTYGFVDIDEIDNADYRALLHRYRRKTPDLY